jgi:hypothetical protein
MRANIFKNAFSAYAIPHTNLSYINFLIALLFLIKNSAPEYKVIATTHRSKP